MAPRPRSCCLAGGFSGLLLAAGTAQVGLGLLCFAGLVPWLLAIDRGARPGSAALAGGSAGLVFFGAALAWVPTADLPVAALALTAVYVPLLAAGWAVLGAVLGWLRRSDRTLFFGSVPLLWIAAESARAGGTFGYPWHQLAHGLADHPELLQLAAWGGALAVSAHVAAVNSALAAAWRSRSGAGAAAACALALAPLALGNDGLETGGELSVTAVQPHELSDDPAARMRVLVAETDRALRAREPDLIVWPEASLPRVVAGVGDPFLGSLALDYRRPLLLGARRREVRGDDTLLFNSAVLASPDGYTRFAGDKVHPVAVYERAPDGVLSRLLERAGVWPGRFQAGARAGLVETAAGPVGVLMCFDSSFPELARDLRTRGAVALVELSNEALTGAWSARHHARVSRLRAIETGLPLVRISNTGPSEWVDARGRVHAHIDAGTRGARTASLRLGGPPTPYVRFGSSASFALALFPLIPFTLRGRRPHREESRP